HTPATSLRQNTGRTGGSSERPWAGEGRRGFSLHHSGAETVSKKAPLRDADCQPKEGTARNLAPGEIGKPRAFGRKLQMLLRVDPANENGVGLLRRLSECAGRGACVAVGIEQQKTGGRVGVLDLWAAVGRGRPRAQGRH